MNHMNENHNGIPLLKIEYHHILHGAIWSVETEEEAIS